MLVKSKKYKVEVKNNTFFFGKLIDKLLSLCYTIADKIKEKVGKAMCKEITVIANNISPVTFSCCDIFVFSFNG